jgi:3-oxoacyl-[acyl-carrier protein] reductase
VQARPARDRADRRARPLGRGEGRAEDVERRGARGRRRPHHLKTALVTGANRRRGIGYAIARRLEAGGARVVTHGFGEGDADVDVVADLADPAAPARVVAAAAPVDVLVVNHAYSAEDGLGGLTADEIDAHLHVNVRASLLLVQEFAEQFDGDGGSVVLLTSGAHLGPMTTEIAYAVSKGALVVAVATLAAALADRGIRVNAVNPGPTNTGYLDGVEPRRMPAGRWGEPDDAARLVAWLCSDEGRWVTGQVIDSEGGFRRWS